MIDIQPLAGLEPDDFNRIVTGYVSPARYRVRKTESDTGAAFILELVQLETPYVKRYDRPDAETWQKYRNISRQDTSLGAYDADKLIGIALAEAQAWNNSLWVWEFHLAESYRGMGIGTRMMESLVERGRQTGLRAIFCETQTTNASAIRFYRRAGFTLDGINLSFYSNDDYPDGEIALFMKRKLQD